MLFPLMQTLLKFSETLKADLFEYSKRLFEFEMQGVYYTESVITFATLLGLQCTSVLSPECFASYY